MYSTVISAQQTKDALEKSECVILDCRFDLMNEDKGLQLYHQEHIEKAQYVNLNTQLSGQLSAKSGRHPLPEISDITNVFSSMGISENCQVIVYDDCSGAIAARAWWLLQWLGHESVAVLDGGIQAWKALNYSCSKTVPVVAQAHFVRKKTAFEVVTTEQICSGEYQLLDARMNARYNGDIEPIDPIAGHIPNAKNRPFDMNLTTEGFFKRVDELAHEFMAFQESNLTHMCGSGVTACHNVLAMAYAGLGPSKLYVGSWSEWIQDASRAVSSLKDRKKVEV